MIGRIILLTIMIGMRLSYTNLVEPIIKNEIYMTQMSNDSAIYVLMQLLPYVDNVFSVICIILSVLIGVDIYEFLQEKKEK